ncbi:MAG: RNAseH domain-containing protein, partial [Planifilum fulgidum]
YYPVQDKHLINGDWILTRPELDYQRNRLRILRITTGDQVPDYYNDEYGKTYSYRSGLFLSEDGVYYSLGQKPKTYRGAVLLTKATDPSELLLQPNLVEILPVGHWDPGEVEEAVRQLHMLRKANLTYDHHTIYPAPLHRLNAAKKYLEAFLTVQRSVKNDRVRI